MTTNLYIWGTHTSITNQHPLQTNSQSERLLNFFLQQIPTMKIIIITTATTMGTAAVVANPE